MRSRRRYLAGRARALRYRTSPKVLIIGAGFGGLAAAVALRRKGIDDLLIVERADGVGGTWRQTCIRAQPATSRATCIRSRSRPTGHGVAPTPLSRRSLPIWRPSPTPPTFPATR